MSSQQNVVNTRNQGKGKCRVQEEAFKRKYPRRQQQLCQDDKKDSGNLADGIDFSKYVGTKVAKTDRCVEDHRCGNNAYVTAEY